MSVEENKEYLEIKIPKLKQSNFLTLALILLLMFMSFTLGSLYTKVLYLKQGGNLSTASNTANTKNAREAFNEYAKQLNLNTKKFEACLKDRKYTAKINADVNEAGTLGVQGTPGFFVNGIFVGGAFPYASFKEIIDKELSGGAPTDITLYTEANLKEAYKTDPKGFDPVKKNVEIGDAAVRGEQNAKITIVEYSDFQCPYCERSFPVMNQILDDYRGKVKLVYKHLPLSFHPNAQQAAEAAECAGEQNKFWEYHDLLFEKQQEWSPLTPQTT